MSASRFRQKRYFFSIGVFLGEPAMNLMGLNFLLVPLLNNPRVCGKKKYPYCCFGELPIFPQLRSVIGPNRETLIYESNMGCTWAL